MVFASGDLREPLSSRKRADLIVVTKTPPDLTQLERKRITARVKPFKNQQIFFSYLEYGNLVNLHSQENELILDHITKTTHVMLLTGIANPKNVDS